MAMSVHATRAAAVLRSTPPSGLPAISPSRGEIGSVDPGAFSSAPESGGYVEEAGISPLEGEMAGRPEGGPSMRNGGGDLS
jgi:hypothetical protein